MASIDVNNSATIFLTADMHNAQGLRDRAMNFILSNFDQVSKTPGFEQLARQNVDTVLEILRNRSWKKDP